jgi:4-amino-4-deoxy-L-arabinose transferase-like glycosyltransferase
MPASRLLALAVFAITALALLPDLGGQYVWSKDEARDGLVARDMVERGHRLIPHIAGRVYPYKPPLFHWLVALLSPHGVTEWSLRLPSVLAGAATAAVTCAMGARLATPAAGLVAAAILASSFAFVGWARTGRLEMLLVLWLTWGLSSGMRWLDEGRRRDALVLGLALGLGCLTKGPVGLAPLGALLVALTLLGRWSRRAAADLGLTLAVAALLPAVWLGLAASAQGGVHAYLVAVVANVADEVRVFRSHRTLFVAEAIGTGFLPWTPLLPGALLVLVRAGRTSWRALLLPVLWAAFILVVFTAVISPRAVHFLPIYPALAVLVSWAWSSASDRERRWMIVPLGLTVLSLAAVGLFLIVSPLAIEWNRRTTVLGRGLGVAIVALAVAAALGGVALLRRRRVEAVPIVVAAGALIVLIALEVTVYTPRANRAHPTREAAARFSAAAPPQAEIAYLDRKFSTGLVFYLRQRPVEVLEMSELRDLVSRPGARVLVPFEEMLFINGGVCLPTRAVAEERVFGDRYVLLDFEGEPARWCLWPPGS